MKIITLKTIKQCIEKNEIELSSTHSKLCLPIINRIYRKMSVGIKFAGIRVHDGLICDGHHRYIASILSQFPIEKIPGTTTAATTQINWESVIFDKEDWDTPAKIKMLNEQDAAFNNIPLEEIAELLG